MQDVGLQLRHNNNQKLALHLIMLYAVAFLPPADVVQGFQELVDEVRYIYNEEVDQLLDYFKYNFICCFRKKYTLSSSINCTRFMEYVQQNRR